MANISNRIDEQFPNTETAEEHEVFTFLISGDDETQEASAERIAFTVDTFPEVRWNRYYGPNAAGYPALSEITVDTINYWKKRASEASHPLLRIRYADLVWDLSKKATGESPRIEFAHRIVDQTLELWSAGTFSYRWRMLRRIERALHIAIAIKDSIRKDKLVDALWGFLNSSTEIDPYFVDVIFRSKGDFISSERQDEFLTALLDRALFRSGVDHFQLQGLVIKLGRELRKRSRTQDLNRVLDSFVEGILELIASANGLLGSAWLQKAYEAFCEAGFHEHSEKLVPALLEKQKGSIKDFATFSVPMSVTKDELEDYTQALTEGGFNTALIRIAHHFVVSKADIHQSTEDGEQTFFDWITKSVVDDEGREVSRVGSIKDDPEGNAIHEIARLTEWKAPFFAWVVRRFIADTPDFFERLSEKVDSSIAIPKRSTQLVQRSLKAYASGDLVAFVHLLTPQIETAIRHVHRLKGGDPYRLGRNGGLDLRTLDDLLGDSQCEKALGQEICLYMKVLLSDRRGLNIRNRLCHGMLAESQFTDVIANAVLHCLFLILLLEASPTFPEESRENGA